VNLPTGTVTFLFTDIEGSTKRWEQNAQAMRSVLARHDAVMRQAIAGRNGHVFKTIGDAFCAVFQRAEEGIEACFEAQKEMRKIEVPEVGPVRVRMALHTGEADERDGDYFGPAVNRVARLLSIGHGEQVLVSATTHSVAVRWLPSGMSLRDMGMHRLKDLADAEHVYQLAHPELRADFPPLRSQESLPNNLPRQLSSFVGRERELAHLKELASGASLLTLTGAGGCGKTRLALRLAQSMLSEFPDGVWLVELAPLSEPSLVASAALQALGLREQSGKPVMQTITEHLANKRVLFVLDNCEHLLEACAQFVSGILSAGADDKVIATSREALGVGGEVAYRVPSLSMPINGTSQADELLKYESIALFVERARSAKPGFTLTDQMGPAVAKICRRLDGIPLAIELAAARVKVLSVDQIHAKLDDRFRLLTGGSRTALERHQTLRAAIAWSYGMLSEDEKHLLRGLSVFAGGWSLEAASRVCCLPDPANPESCRILDEFEVLDLLTHLVDKSLVVVEETGSDEARYRLLETVRQFAHEEAAAAKEDDDNRSRHLAYFLELAESAESKLVGAEGADWIKRLQHEHENLLAALQYSKTLCDLGETGLRLALSICRFWDIRGYLTIAVDNLSDMLELASKGASDDQPRRQMIARASNAAGWLALARDDRPLARKFLNSALSIARELGDKRGIANSLSNLSFAALRENDYTSARQHGEESLALRRELNDPAAVATSLNNLALAAIEQGDFTQARAWCNEALSINRKLGNRVGIAMNLGNLGSIASNLCEFVAARAVLDEAMAINRELGNRPWLAANLRHLGEIAMRCGDLESAHQQMTQSYQLSREIDERRDAAEALLHLGAIDRLRGNLAVARTHLILSLDLCRELGSRMTMAECLEQVGELAVGCGAPEQGVRILGAADALRAAIGAPLSPADKSAHDRSIAQATALLDADVFARADAAGRAIVGQSGEWEPAADEASDWLRSAPVVV
jgi:predicted ATPase/class 3 adenylate cyclase